MLLYKIQFHPKAEKEFLAFDKKIQEEIIQKIKKIKEKPLLGKPLGKKYGINLTGCRGIYFHHKKQRIVYSVQEKIITIFIISIGKRSNEKVYHGAFNRV